MLRKSSPPIEPARGDAPSTATLAGSKNGRREATTAAWSRSSTRARYASAGAIGNSSSTVPSASRRVTSKPASPKTRSMATFPAQHLGDEALDAVRGGERGELLEQARADAAALELVGDGEGHLGGRRVAQPVVGRHRHHALASVRRERPDQRAAVGPVRVERVADQRGRERREPVEAQVEALRGEALEEREERGPVGLGRRAEPERAPVLEDDVEHLRFRGHGPHHAAPAARRAP